MLMSSMCIIDNTLTHLIKAFPYFNSICKYEQIMWIILYTLQRLILSSLTVLLLGSLLLHVSHLLHVSLLIHLSLIAV
jgi:hypothetical protein